MKRRVISNIILNIIASIIPVFTLQFLFLPLVASRINMNSYGQLLTMLGLMNLSASTLGSVLNNSKLLNFKKYEKLKLNGDFNIIALVFLVINVCIMTFALWYYNSTFNLISIFLIIASIFLLLVDYGRVEFRINLNYRYILLDSIFLVLGYGLGYILFILTKNWAYIFLCGYITCFIFIFRKTKIYKDPLKRTFLFSRTNLQTFTLLVSGILLGTATYVDRLLLFPLLGGQSVSIYYISTILGKTIFLVIQPIAGVLLSYLAQFKKFENKYFYILVVISLTIGILGYLLTIFVSRPVLTILYPQYAEGALQYIKITTLTAIISLFSTLLNPLILKFCHLKWQLVINTTYLINYIVFSVVFLQFYGLMGFCIGILIANIINLFVMILIYYLSNIKTVFFREV